MGEASFHRHTVVSFEGLRPDVVTALIERHDGTPLRAPAVGRPSPDTEETISEFADDLFRGTLDVVCFGTGASTRMLLDLIECRHGPARVAGALHDPVVMARAGDPRRELAVRDVPVDRPVSGPVDWTSVLDECLASPGAPRLALEQNGEATRLPEGLDETGARILRLPTAWRALPDDRLPLKNGIRALIGREAKIALFTGPAQVANLMAVAADHGWARTLRRALGDAVIGARSPDTSRALRAHDFAVDVEPEDPRPPALVARVAAHPLATV